MFNDRLDDLFNGATTEVRTAPVRPAAVTYKTAEQRFEEGCTKCRGTGQTRWGVCFKCQGAGKKVFKTSPQARAQSRVSAANRKERLQTELLAEWQAANPQAYEWLVRTAPRWELAQSLLNGLERYGSLTDKQMGIVRNGIIRDTERAAQRAAQAFAPAPTVDTAGVDRLKAAFDKAVEAAAERGLSKAPRITIGGITLSPAKAASKNPGAIYAKVRGGEYLGKIAGGRFFASRECTAEQAAQIQKFVEDPAAAAKVYGQETGTCCICNATLRSEWRLRGIGPICAQKFGW